VRYSSTGKLPLNQSFNNDWNEVTGQVNLEISSNLTRLLAALNYVANVAAEMSFQVDALYDDTRMIQGIGDEQVEFLLRLKQSGVDHKRLVQVPESVPCKNSGLFQANICYPAGQVVIKNENHKFEEVALGRKILEKRPFGYPGCRAQAVHRQTVVAIVSQKQNSCLV